MGNQIVQTCISNNMPHISNHQNSYDTSESIFLDAIQINNKLALHL